MLGDEELENEVKVSILVFVDSLATRDAISKAARIAQVSILVFVDSLATHEYRLRFVLQVRKVSILVFVDSLAT